MRALRTPFRIGSPGIRLAALALAVFASVPLAGAAALAAVQSNSVWTIHVGTPLNTNRDGEVTVVVEYEYQDANGVKKKGKKKSVVPIKAGMTQDAKQKAVDKAITKDAPKVPPTGGTALYGSATGLGNTVQVAPNPGTANFQNVKIKKVKIKDKKTNERDKVAAPPASSFAVTSFALEGEIAGHDGLGGGSVLSFESNFQGTVEFALEKGSSKLELLMEMELALKELGALTLMPADGSELFTILPEGVLVGIGSDDETLTTVLSTEVLE